MKRDIYSKLLDWKLSPRRKPLILKGARQVGKTYILTQFGENEYEKVAYFNFETTPSLNAFFEQNIDPHQIITNLSFQIGFDILSEKHLIIFDEIQNSNNALNSLKYFNEQANEYHITCAGSMLGLQLNKPKSFPVGKVNFLDLFPMSFNEFIRAIGKTKLFEYIDTIRSISPIPQPLHEELLSLLRIYYFIGGMPEAVGEYQSTNRFDHIRDIHQEILRSYEIDFTKHSKATDIPKIKQVWESIPDHLSKENKKFIFSAIHPSARAREYENAIQWLSIVGLIHKSYQISTPKYPLSAYVNKSNFKVFMLDIGLLGALTNLPMRVVLEDDKLFTEFKGALIENYVAQQLITHFKIDLHYWTSDGKAEVDFILPMEEILPLEAKAGINTKSRSLKTYNEKYSPKFMLRSTLRNLRQDGQILNVPLYALSQIKHLIL
jgi:predicted AAA+ superfamily ATPase|tara:strand:+ start:1219 stop:2523 length:1305 start_codon:yes stop_codon:yes gene_type:complete